MSFVNNLAADFKAVGTNNPVLKNADNLSTVCQWGKVASVALAVAALVGAIFSGPVGMFVLGLTAIALFDTYKVLDNIQSIADTNGAGRALGSMASAALSAKPHAKITRGTIFARPIASFIAK